MGWFASQMQSVCKKEIAENNALVMDALAGMTKYAYIKRTYTDLPVLFAQACKHTA